MTDIWYMIGLYLVHTPPGLRKSGMPDSVLIPAPVNTTTRSARSSMRLNSLILA